MEKINLSTLLDAGVHFGHQTRRWNPKMKPYIFGSRGDIYILDLKQTLIGLDEAYTFVSQLAAKGGVILFVGTKKQAQEAVADAANRCGMPYVANRWLGGMLTNFATIRTRVNRMEELEAMNADGRMGLLPKKEQILLQKELAKLQANLNGIRNMKKVPDAVFIIDTNREEIAVHEAQRLKIPIVGTLDTNCDPDDVDYGIPANDDAIRAVTLLADFIAEAVIAGSGTEVTLAEMAGDVPVGQVVTEVVETPAGTVMVEAVGTNEGTSIVVEEPESDDEIGPTTPEEGPEISEGFAEDHRTHPENSASHI
ncbi:MAG: 30S ribosomal protein S2 [Eggerthellaceae bacterium]|nr:30S ribosomal protein S2 [Eggerthellaceae bacterium]